MRLPIALALLLLGAAPAAACNVPVFRYALERWPADPYELILFHRGPLSPADKALADALTRHSEDERAVANYTLTRIDLARNPSPEMLKLFEEQKAQDLPLLVARYPEAARLSASIWAGQLTRDSASALLDSPARHTVAQRILGGDSAVWILLESGDKSKDESVAKRLGDELAKLQTTLKLPDLTSNPEDRLSDKGPELKLAFSLVRVSRADPRERVLVEMLLGLEDDLRTRTEPMAFAVFGRGRALPPLIGAGITSENIRKDGVFLTGPCTCKVKEQNPGVDLLIVADWEAPPDRQPAVTLSEESSSGTLSPAAVPSVSEAPCCGGVLLRNVALATAGGLVLVGGLTFLLMRRGKGADFR
ncbi:MAG: hypothetical protein L0Z62_14040 [Gemmataceae bacterium]|nr:hypothetical protein [Gemmataceae bacterium]